MGCDAIDELLGLLEGSIRKEDTILPFLFCILFSSHSFPDTPLTKLFHRYRNSFHSSINIFRFFPIFLLYWTPPKITYTYTTTLKYFNTIFPLKKIIFFEKTELKPMCKQHHNRPKLNRKRRTTSSPKLNTSNFLKNL